MAMLPPNANHGGDYPPLEDGLQGARCALMAYVGTQEDEYQGTVNERPKLVLGFIYPEHTWDFKGEGEEEPYFKTKTYTFNLGRKANLRRDLEAWRGQKWSEDWPDFDITKVLGTAVQHNIIHSEDGKKFYIENYIRVKNQNDVPPLTQAPICYDVRDHDQAEFERLPKWIQDVARKAPEFPGDAGDTDGDDLAEAANRELAAESIPSEDDPDLPF